MMMVKHIYSAARKSLLQAKRSHAIFLFFTVLFLSCSNIQVAQAACDCSSPTYNPATWGTIWSAPINTPCPTALNATVCTGATYASACNKRWINVYCDTSGNCQRSWLTCTGSEIFEKVCCPPPPPSPPSSGGAGCEPPGAAAAAAANVQSLTTARIAKMVLALEGVFNWSMDETRLEWGEAMDRVRSAILGRLNLWWRQMSVALKNMTQQISASSVNQVGQLAGGIDFPDPLPLTDKLSSIQDANNSIDAAFEMAKTQINAKLSYQPTVPACRFDTAAVSMSAGRAISDALTVGFAKDFSMVGTNDINSPYGAGNAAVQAKRWAIYQKKFCDMFADAGMAGCNTVIGTANLDILPSKTIFEKETIDIDRDNDPIKRTDGLWDADTHDAVIQLLFNITGYNTPDPTLVGALPSAQGRQQRQSNREYLAQMDAMGALAYSVVAERAPGVPAPDIKAQRMRMGVMDASDRPSIREVRQSVVEQLWDPVYYKELYDNPGTVAQKELYLKAYSLVMLYDMISKQEKISNVYAIETANMLKQGAPGRLGSINNLKVK